MSARVSVRSLQRVNRPANNTSHARFINILVTRYPDFVCTNRPRRSRTSGVKSKIDTERNDRYWFRSTRTALRDSGDKRLGAHGRNFHGQWKSPWIVIDYHCYNFLFSREYKKNTSILMVFFHRPGASLDLFVCRVS